MPDLKTVQEFVGEDFTAEEWDEVQEAQNRYYLELAQDQASDEYLSADDIDRAEYMYAD